MQPQLGIRKRFIRSLWGVDRCSFSWGSGRGLLEVFIRGGQMPHLITLPPTSPSPPPNHPSYPIIQPLYKCKLFPPTQKLTFWHTKHNRVIQVEITVKFSLPWSEKSEQTCANDSVTIQDCVVLAKLLKYQFHRIFFICGLLPIHQSLYCLLLCMCNISS